MPSRRIRLHRLHRTMNKINASIANRLLIVAMHQIVPIVLEKFFDDFMLTEPRVGRL